MKNIELLEMLTKNAKEFRKDRDQYTRNAHLHSMTCAPDQGEIDAVLTEFINFVGIQRGVDYALKASDLHDSSESPIAPRHCS